jgi:hypothetical protein
MSEILKFKVTYFKKSGKYYSSEEFSLAKESFDTAYNGAQFRENILNSNYRDAPGLSNDGKEFIWVVEPVGEHSFPRLIPAVA